MEKIDVSFYYLQAITEQSDRGQTNLACPTESREVYGLTLENTVASSENINEDLLNFLRSYLAPTKARRHKNASE